MSMEACSPCGDKQDPTSRITVSKEQAKEMKVGDQASVKIAGEVVSIMPRYDDKEKYDVEIKNPTTEAETSEKKEEDKNPATMPKEKLKKSIMKSDEE